MKGLRQCVLLLLLTLWVPATVHCDLELLPGFDFLACGDAPSDSHTEAGCAQDSCAAVESGFYKLEDHSLSIVPPTANGLCALPAVADTGHLATEFSPIRSSLSGGVVHSWRFSLRAALPPRAPCPLS